MVFLVGMEGWFMVCQILHCHVFHCYTRAGNKAWNKTFSFCGAGRMEVCSLLYSFTFCFALWLVRPNIKMRCNKWWKGQVRTLRFVCKPSTSKGSKGWDFLPLLHLLLSPPSHLLSYKMLQCFTIIMTKTSTWKPLQSLCSSLCRAGFIEGCSLARSIWIHEHHFAMRKWSLLVFAHFKVESFPINTLHIIRI